MPARVSTMRVGSLPLRSSRVIDLVTNAPSRERSMKSAYSKAYPHVPEQVKVGFASLMPARSTDRSGVSLIHRGFYGGEVKTQAASDVIHFLLEIPGPVGLLHEL